jgi:hypothetical protein
MTADREFGRSARLALAVLLALLGVGCIAAASAVAANPSEYGIESSSVSLSTAQAGDHPDVQFAFKLKTDPASFPDPKGLHEPYARTRNLSVELPPGLIGNPNAIATCTPQQFESYTTKTGTGCPAGSQVGVVVLQLYPLSINLTEPIFNMPAPSEDVVARLGFYAATLPNFIDVHVRSQSDYGLTAKITGIPSDEGLVAATTTLWGVPADSSHNTLRLTPQEAFPEGKSQSPPRSSGVGPAPFMTNPTTCGAPDSVITKADSYQLPGVESESSAPMPAISGCGLLDFAPTLTVTPTTPAAASPSGLDAALSIPQNESVEGLATSQLRNSIVRLPNGVSIAPSAADGLGACDPSQVHLGEDVAAACPDASKIGTAEFDVPALSRILDGSIYQRAPEPGHLFRIWLVADELGVHVKIQGDIQVSPTTGQITSIFLDTPQVPVKTLSLHFKGGPRGVVITPASCGTFESEWEFGPWSGGLPAVGQSPFPIDERCATGGFAPRLDAGSTNPAAGSSTHFLLDLNRADGERNLAAIDVTLPNGLLAKPKGVPLCEGAAAETGQCPAGSQVGTVSVAAGAGSNPLWIPQPGKAPTAVYLAGPYHGAPYSLVVRVPAQAGPFDLGTVVTRAAIQVDPTTAQVTVKSDPLPQILEGVPILYRTIHVDIDRSDFTFNPTNCEPTSVAATAISDLGGAAHLSTPFQVGSCASLGFSPKLSFSLKGPTRRSGHPALKAVLTQPAGQANIGRVSVVLPRSQFIDQSHVSNACTRPQFAEGKCPPKSVLGRARAFTPLLDKPLEGPVYFRANGGARELPDIVADLNGQIHIVLVGFVDHVGKKGSEISRIRNTFATIPDAPVSKFVFELNGGKKLGLLQNSSNLCSSPQRAIVKMTGQNGKPDDFEAKIATSCKQ